MKTDAFYREFDETGSKDWLDAIRAEIGETAMEELSFRVDPDWSIPPFQHADQIDRTTALRTGRQQLSWQILESFGLRQADNEVIMQSLSGGCEALHFKIGPEGPPDFSSLLSGVQPDLVGLHLETRQSEQLPSLLDAFSRYVQSTGSEGKKLSGSIRWLVDGQFHSDDLHRCKGHLDRLGGTFPSFNALCWHFPFSDYETGLTLPMARVFMEMVRFLEAFGDQHEREKLLGKTIIRVTIGQDYFREIIRLRAIRLLWYNMLKAHGLGSPRIYVEAHFDPGQYNQDTEKNMIRAGTMAMASIIGGADAVYILPADGDPRTADSRLRRIARNIHHLLRHESYLEKHTDPVQGAYFFEAVVPELVRKVWARITDDSSRA